MSLSEQFQFHFTPGLEPELGADGAVLLAASSAALLPPQPVKPTIVMAPNSNQIVRTVFFFMKNLLIKMFENRWNHTINTHYA